MKTYQLFIGNEFVDAVEGGAFETLDPFTGEPWARVPQATQADVDRAVASAKVALDGPGVRSRQAIAACCCIRSVS